MKTKTIVAIIEIIRVGIETEFFCFVGLGSTVIFSEK
jgi:hypothetical protein